MQRRIIDALAERTGGDFVERSNGYGIRLANGVHDMRKVAKELAMAHGGFSHQRFISVEWGASFSRAVRSLVRSGILEFPALVPLVDDEVGVAHHLADGIYLIGPNDRQRRFGRPKSGWNP
jgi:hypothetical protein